ncbi:integrase [Pseudoalteromonas maricaloris]|uniref:phage integrase N-terminal domain-containing protein n=1 Tax=Pseudoalteromonas maricaloris TaxID=184924 RepID=UPI0021ADA5B5|nr:phage integrase N-terminal domain-containing protein [Pseudoalteromonas flavipulchra]USE70935.1 integrase [Pseudoalteromonas flavipulchra]
MKKLNYQLKELTKHNRDGSFQTQGNRSRILQMTANQLHELGFRNLGARGLKEKHVNALVNRWQEEKLTPGTIKNRMAILRWWAGKIGKPSIIPKHNKLQSTSSDTRDLNIANRTYSNNANNKAKDLDQIKLNLVTDERIKVVLELQRAFGLRKEEALKFRPTQAIRKTSNGSTYIQFKAGTKGGKERVVHLSQEHSTREYQVAVLDKAKLLAGRGSMIPSDKSYKQGENIYRHQCQKAGLDNNHGLRHAYAQERYYQLTGWLAPKAGGPTSRQLTPEAKEVDQQARFTISKELGHEREQITVTYLGR